MGLGADGVRTAGLAGLGMEAAGGLHAGAGRGNEAEEDSEEAVLLHVIGEQAQEVPRVRDPREQARFLRAFFTRPPVDPPAPMPNDLDAFPRAAGATQYASSGDGPPGADAGDAAAGTSGPTGASIRQAVHRSPASNSSGSSAAAAPEVDVSRPEPEARGGEGTPATPEGVAFVQGSSAHGPGFDTGRQPLPPATDRSTSLRHADSRLTMASRRV